MSHSIAISRAYTAAMRTLVLITFLAAGGIALAQDPPPDEILDNAEIEELDVGEADLNDGEAAEGEEPMALEEVIVTGERFTLEQETALRMVRQALQEKKTYKMEDKDKWVCWYRKPVGTRMTYLECARNGDLIALQPRGDNLGDMLRHNTSRLPGYGTIMRSQRPVNKKKFEAMLESLPGSDDVDKEFVALSLAGQTPPRDIPSDAALDDFTRAYRVVNNMTDDNEAAMIQAIEMQGLSVDRYNRIVDLLQTYQSIENEVAMRLGTWQPPDS